MANSVRSPDPAEPVNAPHTKKGVTHLEDLREEARTNLLTEEVINAGQAGYGTAQGPVRGWPDPVGSVDAVERQVIRASVTLLWVAEAALSMVVHGAGRPPRPAGSASFPQLYVLDARQPEAHGYGGPHHCCVTKINSVSREL